MGVGGGQLISVYPEELTFELELEKSSYCNLKVINNSEHHVAFKVKTTSPKKYFVRPNTGVVQPWDSCSVTVTLQAQSEFPADMQCKDKFLIQSTKVPQSTDIDEIPPDTFNKDGDKVIEDLKLRVVYCRLAQRRNSEEESGLTSSARGRDTLKNTNIDEVEAIKHLKEEKDFVLQQNLQLLREVETLKRRRSRKKDNGFSLTFAALASLVGLMVGFILNLTLTTPTA